MKYMACEPCSRLMGAPWFERSDWYPKAVVKRWLPKGCLNCGAMLEKDCLCPCGAFYGPPILHGRPRPFAWLYHLIDRYTWRAFHWTEWRECNRVLRKIRR